VTLVGLSDAVRLEAETDAESATVPEKLLRLETVMVAIPDEPDWIFRLEVLLEIPKSGAATTLTVTVVECDRDPLVPVTVTT
jgi:hypothetical protein